MRSREKYFWQSVIGLVAALYLVFSISESSNLRCWSCSSAGCSRALT
jgi:phospho-N-acetylmuramoyl-pentapeptide-transferase